MVIFAETKEKKDDQHEDKEPPEVRGGVQGEGRLGSDVRKPDAARTVQQTPTQSEPDQPVEEAAERAQRGRLQDRGQRQG